MAPSQTVQPPVANSAPPGATSAFAAWWVVALGWLFPGLGYLLQRKWVRGGLVFVCVAGMFGIGLSLQGQVYAFNTGDVLQMLGWIGDICAGLIYFLARVAGAGAGNLRSVMGNYGTTFLISAGLLNLLAAADARDVYLGKKQ